MGKGYAYLRAMWPCATAVTHEKIAVGHTATFELSLHHVVPRSSPLIYVQMGDGKTRRPHDLSTGIWSQIEKKASLAHRGWHGFQKIDSDREMPEEMGGLGMKGLFLM
jgi:hypothetical protein